MENPFFEIDEEIAELRTELKFAKERRNLAEAENAELKTVLSDYKKEAQFQRAESKRYSDMYIEKGIILSQTESQRDKAVELLKQVEYFVHAGASEHRGDFLLRIEQFLEGE